MAGSWYLSSAVPRGQERGERYLCQTTVRARRIGENTVSQLAR